MLVLSTTTDKIEVVMGGAIATAQSPCVACYRDIGAATYTPSVNAINTNSTTDVTVVGSPSSGLTRVVDYLSVVNNDTAAIGITIKLDRNGTEYKLWVGTIAVGSGVEYVDGAGFRTK